MAQAGQACGVLHAITCPTGIGMHCHAGGLGQMLPVELAEGLRHAVLHASELRLGANVREPKVKGVTPLCGPGHLHEGFRWWREAGETA